MDPKRVHARRRWFTTDPHSADGSLPTAHLGLIIRNHLEIMKYDRRYLTQST